MSGYFEKDRYCSDCEELREFIFVRSIMNAEGTKVVLRVYQCVECGHEIKLRPSK